MAKDNERTIMKLNAMRLIVLIATLVGTVEVANAFYDPGLQRWITRDPIAEQGGINLFAFAGNNSITMADKYGECPALLIPLLALAEGATALTATEVGILGATAFGVGATAVAVTTPTGIMNLSPFSNQ